MVGFFGGNLYSDFSYFVTVQQEKALLCSVCNCILVSEDFLQELMMIDKQKPFLICCACLKKIRGKGGKGEAAEELAISFKEVHRPLSFHSDRDDAVSAQVRDDRSMMLPRLAAGRRRPIIFLRDARTGLERKNKERMKSFMEEEAEVARQYAWKYRIVNDSTIEVEHGIDKFKCSSVNPLLSFSYRGHCAVLTSESGHMVYDFYSGRIKSFSFLEEDELKFYLEKNGYGFDFKKYTFEHSLEKKKVKKKGRVLFFDQDSSPKPLVTENIKSPFYYAVDEDRKTLLVGNDDGAILKWPMEQTIIGLLVKDTQAVVTTVMDSEVKQFWLDFARHNEEKAVLLQDYPIDFLEAPVQSKEQLIKKGFSESLVREKSFDSMFHEMAIIPEGFIQKFHSSCSLSELLGHLKPNEGRSLQEEERDYQCLLDAKKTKIEVTVYKKDARGHEDEEEGFEVTINNPKDHVWKRGSEVLIPDNGCLVLYNFKTEIVQRFDTSLLPSVEKEFNGLGFREIK